MKTISPPTVATQYRHLLLALLAPAFLACSEQTEAAQPEDTREEYLEVFSSLTSDAETQALDAVLEHHATAFPNTTIINAAVQGGANEVRSLVIERLEDKVIPDAFQATLGRGLHDWAVMLDEEGPMLQPLTFLAEEPGFLDALPPNLVEALSYQGELYALPFSLHRANSLYFNKSVFQDHDLSAPESIEELFLACETLAGVDGELTPLTWGARSPWTIGVVAFENLLIALEGADYYEALFRGQGDPNDPGLRTALERTLELFQHANADLPNLTWDQSLTQLEQGQAAMTIAGDWAKGTLEARGMTMGEGFEQVPMPGTSEVFVMTADTLVMPTRAPSPEATQEFLRTLASPEGQLTFNSLNGSVPARTDVDPDGLDAHARDALDALAGERVVLSVSALMPGEAYARLQTALSEFVEARNPGPVLEALEAYYSSL